MKYLIEVTQEDIEAGNAQDPYSCPIALACERITGNKAGVDPEDITLYHEDNWSTRTHGVPHPLAVQFMRDFDNHYPVSPFSFELEVE